MANKRRNEIERLEEELKQLQQENRRLKRQTRQSDKYPKAEKKEKTTSRPQEGSCVSCGKGDLSTTTFEFPNYHLLVMKCDICGHTERQRLSK